MPVDDSKSEREQRLAAALRANLRRRKQQAREQQTAKGADSRGNDESDAGEDEASGIDRPAGKTR